MRNADLERLRGAVLALAKDLLRRGGEFQAFGATLSQSGVPAFVAIASSPPGPSREQLAAALVRESRSMSLRAVCVCSRTEERPSGVAKERAELLVQFEHANGESADVYVGLAKGWFGRLKVGSEAERPGTLRVFGPPSNNGMQLTKPG